MMDGAWLPTLLATLVAVAVTMLALGVGLIFGRHQPRGSCGGPGETCPCDAATGPCELRELRR